MVRPVSSSAPSFSPLPSPSSADSSAPRVARRHIAGTRQTTPDRRDNRMRRQRSPVARARGLRPRHRRGMDDGTWLAGARAWPLRTGGYRRGDPLPRLSIPPSAAGAVVHAGCAPLDAAVRRRPPHPLPHHAVADCARGGAAVGGALVPVRSSLRARRQHHLGRRRCCTSSSRGRSRSSSSPATRRRCCRSCGWARARCCPSSSCWSPAGTALPILVTLA